TLAWTEVRLPRSLESMPTGPASTVPQRVILTWQDAPVSHAAPIAAGPAPQGCTTTVLITQPCTDH
ncbi:MAG TPA: hypothetical protein VNH46_01585, partial [Gemmatimonadales bacterium]|nr:hypothetical protein [Gemmatimonadales bacterium]